MRVDGIVKAYQEGGAETSVLRGAGLELPRGATTSLVGASGSGKSTLVGLIAGLMPPDAGKVVFDGQDIGELDDTGRARLRRTRIGIVLQSGNLIPFLTAVENVELAIDLGRRSSRPAAGAGAPSRTAMSRQAKSHEHGRRLGRPAAGAGAPSRTAMSRQAKSHEHRGGDRHAANELLAELGLARRLDHRPSRLSGGEAQRVSVAMALANQPDLLLADEVTGELDFSTAEQVMEVIFAVSRARRLTVLYVTHNRELAARAERRLRLVDGTVSAA